MISKQFEVKQKEEAKAMGFINEEVSHFKLENNKETPYCTFVYIMNRNGSILEGIADCSKKDQFSRRTGRVIARGRAMKKARNA